MSDEPFTGASSAHAPEPAHVLEHACRLLTDGDTSAARAALRESYPFAPVERVGRKYSLTEATSIFVRDGFVDRYRGRRLVFPGTLRILSLLLPDEFPYHPNGRMDRSHVAWWELFPTIDHVVPVARGGADDESNWVCCSMLSNGIKANWTLEELGWTLRAPGSMADWDGLLGWFFEAVDRDPALREHEYVRRWFGAALPHGALTRSVRRLGSRIP